MDKVVRAGVLSVLAKHGLAEDSCGIMATTTGATLCHVIRSNRLVGTSDETWPVRAARSELIDAGYHADVEGVVVKAATDDDAGVYEMGVAVAVMPSKKIQRRRA